MAKRIGKDTVILENYPSIIGYGCVVGKKEKEGPLGSYFNSFDNDARFGEKSFEKAESRLQKIAVENALKKANLSEKDIDMIFAGDLLNQCIGSTFGLRKMGISLLGLYGACSTMALGLGISAVMVDSGAANTAIAVTSSHFCSAERQYRFPLEYGALRPQTAQRTVTGSGATILGKSNVLPFINAVTFGKVTDFGITDANNMGAAMAPSAASTLISFFNDTNTMPCDYDAIYSGDLGDVGTKILLKLMLDEGYDIKPNHNDCGLMMFDRKKQDVHSGGSGCGCSASILNSYIMNEFETNKLKNILFMSTGALLSPTSTMQGESIPGISHLVNIKMR